MAAHALRMIRQSLYDRTVDVKTCEQIEHACGFAPGFDMSLEQEDWNLLFEVSKTRVPAAMKAALESVLKRVAYMEAYRMSEDVNEARRKYVLFDTDGWMDRSRSFATLPAEEHSKMAAALRAPVGA